MANLSSSGNLLLWILIREFWFREFLIQGIYDIDGNLWFREIMIQRISHSGNFSYPLWISDKGISHIPPWRKFTLSLRQGILSPPAGNFSLGISIQGISIQGISHSGNLSFREFLIQELLGNFWFREFLIQGISLTICEFPSPPCGSGNFSYPLWNSHPLRAGNFSSPPARKFYPSGQGISDSGISDSGNFWIREFLIQGISDSGNFWLGTSH